MVKKIVKKRKVVKKAVKKASKKVVRKVTAKKPVRSFRKAVKAARKQVKVVKKPVLTAPIAPILPVMPKQKLVGVITHFYPNINVGVVDVKKDIKLGDTIIIFGHGRSFEQKVFSMQLEHQPLQAAKKGQLIGMKTAQEVKEKDLIYLK